MDALSTMLASLSAPEGLYIESKLSGPWCLKFEPGPDVWKPFLPDCRRLFFFHYVVEGRLHLKVKDAAPLDLGAHDLVLLPLGTGHCLDGGQRAQPVDATKLLRSSNGEGPFRIARTKPGKRARILSGVFGVGALHQHLLSILPASLVVATGRSPEDALIRQSLDLAAREVAEAKPGAMPVVSNLLRLAFVVAARDHLTKLPVDDVAQLAKVRDTTISKVLMLIHLRYAEDWTTPALAHHVGLSRSSFAERFTKLVGVSPMRYLTSWRMKMAAQQLREGQASAAQTAFDVGFSSEAAFSRAFKREFGAPPAAWRKRFESAATGFVCLVMTALTLLNIDSSSLVALTDSL